MPLLGHVHLGLDRAAGVAVVFQPGIAVTNAHNANLVDPKSVIGTATFYAVIAGYLAGGASQEQAEQLAERHYAADAARQLARDLEEGGELR